MAKHAKPSVTSTLSKNGARGAAALAMASLGFAATAPAAFAGGSDGDYDQDHTKHGDVHHGHQSKDVDSHESEGLINVADNDVLVPIQVCNNYVPINILGVQVPIEDVAINIPILSGDDNDADSGGDTCQQPSAVGDTGEMREPGKHDVHQPGKHAKDGGGVVAAADPGEQGLGDGALGVGDLAEQGGVAPAQDLTGEGVAPGGTGDALGAVPQEQGAGALTDTAGDLGMANLPNPAQVNDLAPAGL